MKKLQKVRVYYFSNSFSLIFKQIKNDDYNNDNKNLLNELKNRIFARLFPHFPPLRGELKGVGMRKMQKLWEHLFLKA